MALEDLKLLSRRGRIRFGLILLALGALLIWASVHLLEAGPPRHIVLASGPEFSLYHRYAQRYKELLAAEGVTVEERMTHGAAENLQLLLDRTSRVDVAFMQGGVANPAAAGSVVMLASLYYEPFWLFYHGSVEWRNMTQLKGKRLAAEVPGSGTRTLVEGLTKASGLTEGNTALLGLEDEQAFQALKAGEVEAAFFVGGPSTPAIQKALRDHSLVGRISPPRTRHADAQGCTSGRAMVARS